MERKAITGIMLAMLLTLAWSNFAIAELTVELAYDDGDWPYGTCWGVRGKQAVKFSLPDGWTSAKLLTAKYAMEEALEFRIHIYDSDGITELTAPFDVTPPTTGWFEVDLSGLNIIVSGDFYIARESIFPNYVGPYIYIDLSPPIDGRTYYMLAWETSWSQETDCDISIRAVVEQVVPAITADVNIDPDTLNLKSNGKWITAYIELPEGYDVSDIDASSIMLNDTVSAEIRPTDIGDYDEDGFPDLMVKFERQAVINLILENYHCADRFGTVTLTITGTLNDGTQFQGTDTINIICDIRLMILLQWI